MKNVNIFVLIIFSLLLLQNCEKYEKTAAIVTGNSLEITDSSAIIEGDILDLGNGITEYGHCWSRTNPNPTPDNCENKTNFGSIESVGKFTSKLNGLDYDKTYYVSAYILVNNGYLTGTPLSFDTKNLTVKDIEGNVYNTVTLGTQVWMSENLKVTRYRNGDVIRTTNLANDNIADSVSPKFQWAYNGIEGNANVYGRLYTWFAATDSRGICPAGWHVPSKDEWEILANYLSANGYNYDGTTTGYKIAKAMSTSNLWTPSTTEGAPGNTDYPEYKNKSGFSAIPCGMRFYGGTYDYITTHCILQSSTEGQQNTSFFYAELNYSINYFNMPNTEKKYGVAVRCLRD